ncbi:MAG: response regulator [bacterium]
MKISFNIKSLFVAILTTIVIVAIIVISLFSVSYLKNFKNTLISKEHQQLLAAARLTGKAVQEFLTMQSELLSILLDDPYFQKSVMKNKGSILVRNFYNVNQERIITLSVFNAEGILIQRYPLEKNLTGKAYNDRPEIVYVLKEEKLHISNVSFDQSEVSSITLSEPILYERKLIGILRCTIKTNPFFERFIQSITPCAGGFAWVFDEKSTILSYADKNFTNKKQNFFKSIPSNDEGYGLSTACITDDSHICNETLWAYTKIGVGEGAWYLVMALPYSEIMGLIEKHARNTFGMAGLLIFMIVMASVATLVSYKRKSRLEAREDNLAALQDREEKYRSVVNNIPDITWTATAEGEFVFINSKAEIIFGFSKQNIYNAGHDFLFSKIHPDDRERVKENYDLLFESNKSLDIEYRFERRGGEWIWLHMRSLGTYEKDNRIYADGIITEITKRKREEESLQETKQNLEQSIKQVKQSVKNANVVGVEFLNKITHDIRTSINGILGFIELLLKTDLNQNQWEYAETVRKSAQNLLTLINDIMDFLHIEAGKPEFEDMDFDIRTAVKDISKSATIKAQEKGLTIATLINSNVPLWLRGDPGRLKQVITHLVDNAIKYTQEGEVIISAHLERETDTHATILFKVSDTGAGIAQDEQENLFIRSDVTCGETGSGLAISMQLVKFMNGEMGVESEEGSGATFWFTAVLEKQKLAYSAKVIPHADIKGLRVLIVDDNKDNRNILLHYLDSWECICEEAPGGPEALEMLKQTAATQDHAFDLALIDFQMPEMDGWQLAKEIKADEQTENTQLILLTSVGKRGDAIKMKAAGFGGYLTKPVNQSDLESCISMVIGINQLPPEQKKPFLVTRHTISEERHKNLRILLVEDSIVDQKLMAHLLEKAGYLCDIAVNGLEAVSAIAKIPYNLVFMDCEMPEMNGFEATVEIRKQEGDMRCIPIVAITADGDREKCFKAGMDDYIAKPIDSDKLYAIVKKWANINIKV